MGEPPQTRDTQPSGSLISEGPAPGLPAGTEVETRTVFSPRVKLIHPTPEHTGQLGFGQLSEWAVRIVAIVLTIGLNLRRIVISFESRLELNFAIADTEATIMPNQMTRR